MQDAKCLHVSKTTAIVRARLEDVVEIGRTASPPDADPGSRIRIPVCAQMMEKKTSSRVGGLIQHLGHGGSVPMTPSKTLQERNSKNH
jgi:hypothetical protein